ncbi:TraB/GumN family protein, partial [Oleiphilus sp. HI0080]
RYRKKIEELESFEFQIKLISELPSDEESFSDALLNMADFESEWKGLEDAWKQGDADLMYELAIGEGMRDFPSLENYYEVLFFKRNVQMAEKLEQCFSDRVCFMVVGAGHLVGPSGVVDLLQKKGYQLKQL